MNEDRDEDDEDDEEGEEGGGGGEDRAQAEEVELNGSKESRAQKTSEKIVIKEKFSLSPSLLSCGDRSRVFAHRWKFDSIAKDVKYRF